MNKIIPLIAVLCVIYSDYITSQDFVYFDTTTILGINNVNAIGSFDLTDCDSTNEYGFYALHFSDLTLHPNGTLYGSGYHAFQSISDGAIYEIYFDQALNTSSVTTLENLDDSVKAIATNDLGKVYILGQQLWEMEVTQVLPNWTTESISLVGNLPIGLEATGDMTFRLGNFYYLSHDRLIQLDPSNPNNNSIVMDIPPDIPDIHGLVTFHVTCDSAVTYAISTTQTEQKIYELDIEAETLTEICSDTDVFIFAAATQSESIIPECQIWVDLDEDDSSNALSFDYIADTSCLLPIPISDLDVNIYADLKLDSITLELVGIINGTEEYLELNTATNLIVIGSGTHKITLINANNASLQNFETVLESIIYENETLNNFSGERQVIVTAFSEGLVSEIATSYIFLEEENFEVTPTLLEPNCYSETNGNIEIMVSNGQVPYSYLWSDSAETSIIPNIGAGDYFLTIADAYGCEKLDTFHLSQPDSLVLMLNYTGPQDLCDNTGTLTPVIAGGSYPYEFQWSNSLIDSINTEVGSGNTTLTIIDDNGCTVEASFFIDSGDSVLVVQSAEACEGDTFEWDGQSYTSNALICNTSILDNGCDSTFCLDLFFKDSVLVEAYKEICQGNVFDFNGLLLFSDTTIYSAHVASNGCDSTFYLTLEVTEISTQLSDAFCEGDSYSFGGNELTNGGIYMDTLVTLNDCDSVLVLDLILEPAPIIEFSTTGSFCESEPVTISGGVYQSYIWSTGAMNSEITVMQQGTYSLTVVDFNSCTSSETILIGEGSIQDAVIQVIDPFCSGENSGQIIIDLVTGGSAPYLFSLNGQAMQQNNSFEDLEAGVHDLLIEDIEGCQLEITLELNQPNETFIDLGSDLEINLGDSVELQIMTNSIHSNIQWTPSSFLNCDTCLSTFAHPTQTVNYQVTIFNEFGCFAMDEILIQVNQTDGVYIPNVFSPNGDGINDSFTIFSDASISKVNYLRIFDRWGAMIFETTDTPTNDVDLGWNGSFNGQKMQAGIYVFSAELEGVDGTLQKMKGEVVLLK